MGSLAGSLLSKARDMASSAVSGALHALHIKSPSGVFYDIGQYLVQGLANGMADHAKATESAAAMANGVIKTFNDVFQIASPSKVMIEIGKNVNQGFAQGIRGSADDVKSAFKDMNDLLLKSMADSRETIKEEQDKLKKLRESSKPDASAIKEAQALVKENEDVLRRATAGHIELVKRLQDEKKELIGLTNDYDKISEKLKLAKDALEAATKTRDEAVKSFSDQYSTLPDIVTTDAEGNSINQLATYEEALKHQADAVGAYQATLDQLRQLGLDDATYQKLLKEGTADQQFASQLLAGGRTAVQGLNTLDSQLQTVSKTLATNAATNLYQAGVDAAQGLVNGLASQKSKLRKTMEEIAREILTALKKELKIKSPSQAFAEIGIFAMEGFAQGFSSSSQAVTDAVDDAAKDALTAMQRSMRDISNVVTSELNPNPVITPILDLTQVRSQSQELASLTNMVPITAATSYQQAASISSTQNVTQAEETAPSLGGTSVKFEQNNYSPESLSEIEIYRQTKNQLSQLKSALALT
jgi:hypothetical protein